MENIQRNFFLKFTFFSKIHEYVYFSLDFFKHLLANLRIFLSIDIGTTQDDEPDLGQKLSPFGSTSSLQDLVEASSARASVDPNSQSSTWIDKERLKLILDLGIFFGKLQLF